MKAFNEKIILRNLAVDPSGGGKNLIAAINTPVTVYETGTTNLASLFDLDESPIANPVNTDLKGNVVFKVADGVYDVVGAAGTQDETRWDEVSIFDQVNLKQGLIVFTTYAELDAYTPQNEAEERTSYKVTNDPDTSLNGYYSWVSGTTYTKDADLVVNVIEESNTSDAVSGKAVYDHGKKLNVRGTLLSSEYLASKANKPTTLEDYNSHLAIKCDIATGFNIYTDYLPIEDLGLIDGDNIYFSCSVFGRSATLFVETYDESLVLISQINGSVDGFGSVANTIDSSTAFVRFIVIINTSTGVDFVYIVSPVISKYESNELTVDPYLDFSVQAEKADSNSTAIEALETTTNSLAALNGNVSNILPFGDMTDGADWNGGTVVAGGINISGTGTLLQSASKVDILKDESLSVVIHATNNLGSSSELRISFFDGSYSHPPYSVFLASGGSTVSVSLPVAESFTSGDYFLFVNADSAVDVTIRSIVAGESSEVDPNSLQKLYSEYGFLTEYSYANFSKDQLTVNKPEYRKLFAYASGETDDPANGVFVGYNSDNKNAIQRAVEYASESSDIIWQIYCTGEFLATTFNQMSAIDEWTGEYRAMVSLTKDNIHLIGTGEEGSIIFADLPDTGAPLNYGFYQTVTVENKSCTIENIQIKGRNLRYPVHTEANGTNVDIEGAELNYKNVHFWHLGNTGQAWIDWKSLQSYGVGTKGIMTVNTESCRFTSTDDAGYGGHDGYTKEGATFNVINCNFDCTNSNVVKRALNFRMFGNIDSKFTLNLVGNNFNGGEIEIGDQGQSGNGHYARVIGNGNTNTRFSQATDSGYFPEMSDVAIYPKNVSGGVITKYTALDYLYGKATGEIEAIALEDSSNSEKFKAIKNCTLLLSLLPIKPGESIVAGDYVQADSGELIYSATKSTARCVDIHGVLYLKLA